MIKCIISDLDETLLDDEKNIPEINVQAIKKAQELGIPFVIATGRGYTSIPQYLDVLDLKHKGMYSITNNGAIISDNECNKHISFEGLSYEVAKEIVEFGLSIGVCVQVFSATDVYSFLTDQDEKDMLLSFKPDAHILDHTDYSFIQDLDIVKVMYQNLDIPYLQSLENKLSEFILNETTISYSSHRYMEFNKKGISKAVGIEKLLKIMNINKDDVLAIGDNHNDYAMLNYVTHSATVSNGVKELKELCEYVSPYSSCEGGVADIIEHYIKKDI